MQIDRQFPIGPFQMPENPDARAIQKAIQEIDSVPTALQMLLETVTPQQLANRYREASWTVGEVIHHLADSHTFGYTRFILALTADHPSLNSYDQEEAGFTYSWDKMLVKSSFEQLKAIHEKWNGILIRMKPEQWERTYARVPEGDSVTLKEKLFEYAWHGRHHLAHLYTAIKDPA